MRITAYAKYLILPEFCFFAGWKSVLWPIYSHLHIHMVHNNSQLPNYICLVAKVGKTCLKEDQESTLSPTPTNPSSPYTQPSESLSHKKNLFFLCPFFFSRFCRNRGRRHVLWLWVQAIGLASWPSLCLPFSPCFTRRSGYMDCWVINFTIFF